MANDAIALRDELEELTDREEDTDDPLDDEERERLVELRAFEESHGGDWHSLIHEDGFEDHAREYAEELSGIDTSVWPATCIDWKQAAHELSADYTSYEIDGVTFYGRD